MSETYPEIEKIFIREDHLIWKKKRAKDKGFSNLSEDYLKGYEDCYKKLRDKIRKLIENKGGK